MGARRIKNLKTVHRVCIVMCGACIRGDLPNLPCLQSAEANTVRRKEVAFWPIGKASLSNVKSENGHTQ